MKFKWKHVLGVGPRGFAEGGMMMRRDGGSGDAEVSEGDPLMQRRRWTSSPSGTGVSSVHS